MKRETSDQHVERMRREIRRFYKRHPTEFRKCVTEYMVWANSEPKSRGGPTPPEVRATLLATYLNAQEDGIRKADFLAQTAAKGWRWETRSRHDTLTTEGNIEWHIKVAQKLAKNDPEFRAAVAYTRWALRELKGEKRDFPRR